MLIPLFQHFSLPIGSPFYLIILLGTPCHKKTLLSKDNKIYVILVNPLLLSLSLLWFSKSCFLIMRCIKHLLRYDLCHYSTNHHTAYIFCFYFHNCLCACMKAHSCLCTYVYIVYYKLTSTIEIIGETPVTVWNLLKRLDDQAICSRCLH